MRRSSSPSVSEVSLPHCVSPTWRNRRVLRSRGVCAHRKVDVRLPGKGNSNSHGARSVHLIITMIKWIRTSRLSIKNSLYAQRGRGRGSAAAWEGQCSSAFGVRVVLKGGQAPPSALHRRPCHFAFMRFQLDVGLFHPGHLRKFGASATLGRFQDVCKGARFSVEGERCVVSS